jgi:hypothetical protein
MRSPVRSATLPCLIACVALLACGAAATNTTNTTADMRTTDASWGATTSTLTVQSTTTARAPETTGARPPATSTTATTAASTTLAGTTTTAIPAGEVIVFSLVLRAETPVLSLDADFAAAVGNGCQRADVVVRPAAGAHTYSVRFIGSRAAQFSHLFLAALQANSARLGVESFTYAPIEPPAPDDSKPDTEKIAIAAGIVGVLVIVIVACGLRNAKCAAVARCCGVEDGDEDERRRFETPRGAELQYTQHDVRV